MKIKMFTKKQVDDFKEWFAYDPETGVIRWKKARQRVNAGDVAGCNNNTNGYIYIAFNRQLILAHRLAWMLYYGYPSKNIIYHRDGNKINNRIKNLREVSPSSHAQSRKAMNNNNNSGVTGVSWNKSANSWVSQITVHGKRHYLGLYKDFNDAVIARWNAEVEYGFTGCNSTSSAYKYLIENNLIEKKGENK